MVKSLKVKVLIVMLVVMFKAKWVGVPKTLSHLPLLWLPSQGRRNNRRIGNNDLSESEEEILSKVDAAIDRLFKQRIWKAFLFHKRRCLARGLVLAWYAARLEMKIILHFGVGMDNGRLKGHCWVSYPDAENPCADRTGSEGYSEIWSYQVG